MDITIVDGDITAVAADSLITALNSIGRWRGGIDNAIRRVASTQYHAQAAQALRNDPNIEVIIATPASAHRGAFRDVVFVIDDLFGISLREVIIRGLRGAEEAGHKTVTMPAIRLGATLPFGGSVEEKVRETVAALLEHASGSRLKSVTLVIYDDRGLSTQFRRELTRASGRP